MNISIPEEVLFVIRALEQNGFEAFVVGGCVRDALLGKKPKDWDVTTNAKPEEIQNCFDETYYDNDFGMVGVVFDEPSEEYLKVIEVTTYRVESVYSNNRHPDAVSFSKNLEEDLKRRDFTVNAMAYNPHTKTLIDLYDGEEALKNKQLIAVGNPDERFKEDALRILRGVRFASQLGFTIESGTLNAMMRDRELLENISAERIRDEFLKIIDSENPSLGMGLLEKLDILRFVVPELMDSIGCGQNKNHIYDVWEHSVRALQHAADKQYPTHLRLAALFHDIGKPATKEWNEEKKEHTFYGHEVVGAQIARTISKRLRFPKEFGKQVVTLVRHHMFFSDPDAITHSAVRRLVAKVGQDMIWDLIRLRMSDRIGMGRPKEEPYRLRQFEVMIEEVLRDPTSVGMLKIDGNRLIELGEKPGPRIGNILHALLEETLEDPAKNTVEYMETRAIELQKLSNEDLKTLGDKGREALQETEEEELRKIRKQYKI